MNHCPNYTGELYEPDAGPHYCDPEPTEPQDENP